MIHLGPDASPFESHWPGGLLHELPPDDTFKVSDRMFLETLPWVFFNTENIISNVLLSCNCQSVYNLNSWGSYSSGHLSHTYSTYKHCTCDTHLFHKVQETGGRWGWMVHRDKKNRRGAYEVLWRGPSDCPCSSWMQSGLDGGMAGKGWRTGQCQM